MFKKISLTTILTLLACILYGCSDDIFSLSPDSEPEAEIKKGLRLRVPHIDRTRANADESELKISSLTLFAYKMEGDEVKDYDVFQIDLTGNEDGKVPVAPATFDGTKYDSYDIEDFPNGDYQIYIVANGTTVKNWTKADMNKANVDYTTPEKLGYYIKTYTDAMFNYPQQGDNYPGIPMSCLHSNLKNSDGDEYGDALVEINGGATIYADLEFNLAKVTVNVEKAVVGTESTDCLAIESATLKNYAKGFPVFKTISIDQFETNRIQLGSDGLTLSGSALTPTDATKKTYTFYVPETDYKGQPTLDVKIPDVDNPVTIPLGEKNEGDTKYKVTRGLHYAYTLSATGEIELEVLDWTPVGIQAEINAPFELVLDATKISSIGAGEIKEIGYSSDAEAVSVKSPRITINGVEMNFYNSSVTNDKISVWINDNIPYSILEKIANNNGYNSADYKFFHVKANNLLKRVDIGSLSSAATFKVSPQTVIIDLREYISSAITESYINIGFNSNLPNITCTKDATWSDGTSSADITGVFEYVRDTQNPTKNNGTDVIKIGKLDDDSFWSTAKELVVTYTVSGDGIPSNWTDADKQRKVTIKILPYTSTYKIHLYVENGETWNLPHIYVYQCLETPGEAEKYPNTPVGYNQDNTNSAAMDYCFTSDVAFQGWKGFGGIDKNDPENVANSKNGDGFLMNDNYAFNSGNTAKSTDSEEVRKTKTYKFMKFNEEHYKLLAKQKAADSNLKCDGHRCGGYNETDVQRWPGILMYKETSGNAKGWWTYELSGVAQAGRTLIMFANNDATNDARRFPDTEKAGVPLFDYEDKEGWFLVSNQDGVDYVNNRFHDDNPLNGGHQDLEPALASGKMRIYYQVPSGWAGWDNPVLNGWGGSSGKQTNYAMTAHPAGNRWFYVDITKGEIVNVLFLKWNDSWGANDRSFTDGNHAVLSGNSDRYYYYGNGNQETEMRRP